MDRRKTSSKDERPRKVLGSKSLDKKGVGPAAPKKFQDEMGSFYRKWCRLAERSAERPVPGTVHRLRRSSRRIEGILALSIDLTEADAGRKVHSLLKKTLRLSRPLRNRDVLEKIARLSGIPESDLPKMRRRSGRFKNGMRRVRWKLSRIWSDAFAKCLGDASWVEALSNARWERDRRVRLKAESFRLRLAIQTWLSDPDRQFRPVHLVRLSLKTLDAQWRMAQALWASPGASDSAAGTLKRILVKLGRMSDLETLRRAFLKKSRRSKRGEAYFRSIPARQEKIAKSLLESECA
jgi:hypothetical protein